MLHKYVAEYAHNNFHHQLRDCLNASIRPFNNSNEYSCSDELITILDNNGNKLSLKDFLERIVFYLIRIKKKGRLF